MTLSDFQNRAAGTDRARPELKILELDKVVSKHLEPPTAPTEHGFVRSRRSERAGMTCSPRDIALM